MAVCKSVVDSSSNGSKMAASTGKWKLCFAKARFMSKSLNHSAVALRDSDINRASASWTETSLPGGKFGGDNTSAAIS